MKNNNNNNNQIEIPKDIFNRFIKFKKSSDPLNDIETIEGPYYKISDYKQQSKDKKKKMKDI